VVSLAPSAMPAAAGLIPDGLAITPDGSTGYVIDEYTGNAGMCSRSGPLPIAPAR
jgi:hypothetical protein